MPVVSILFDAIASGNLKVIESLLNENPDLAYSVSRNGISPVLWALYNGHHEIAENLAGIKKNLDLFEAAAIGDIQQLKMLCKDESIDINQLSADGFSAIGYAAFFGQSEAVTWLLSYKANVNIPSSNQMKVYPIHSAVATRDKNIAYRITEKILQHGADPNVRQQGGWTPLHEAVRSNDLELVKLLINHDADPDLVNDDGLSPRKMALDKNLTDIITLFK